MVKVKTIEMVAEKLNAPFEVVSRLFDFQTVLNEKHKEQKDAILTQRLAFNESRKPDYDKRNQIINQIPGFWSTVFSNHDELGDYFNDEDKEIFKHLASLVVDGVESDCSFTFMFRENNYFTNESIVKHYKASDGTDNSIAKQYKVFSEGKTTIEVTPVEWKKKSLVPTGVTKENRKKKGVFNNISFFTWLCEPTSLKEVVGDKQFAEIIRDDIWPNPLPFLEQASSSGTK